MDGNIQLMQNRRIFADDGKGLNEALNEVDEDGNGITTKATYFLEFSGYFSSKVSRDFINLRTLQQMIDDPVQVFYAFDLEKVHDKVTDFNLGEELVSAGIGKVNKASHQSPRVKLVTFPIAKNTFQIRVENMDDMYYSQSVNLTAIATALWNSANAEHPSPIGTIKMKELALGANLDIQEMRSRKINWHTRDDDDATSKVAGSGKGDQSSIQDDFRDKCILRIF